MSAGDVIRAIPSPVIGASDMTWDGVGLWVVAYSSDTIYQVDPMDGTVLDSFTIAGVTRPQGITWDGTHLFVADYPGRIIFKVTTAGVIVDSFACPGNDPAGLAWDGANLFHSDYISGTIYKLDATTGTVLDSFGLPEGGEPWGLACRGPDLLVVDDTHDRIYRLTSTGVEILYFSAPHTSAHALTYQGSDLWSNSSIELLQFEGANQPPNAPLVSDQGPFNRAAVNRVTWQHSDPDPGDPQSAAEYRERPDGTSTWATVSIPNPNQFWDSPGGHFVADLYEAQVRTADQAGVWGPWSASFFITAGDAPPGPTWLDPTNGQTIPTSSYTGVISESDLTASEWTLFADDGVTIVQGPVEVRTGDLRRHTFTGLVNNTTVVWSVRRERDGLWSQPVTATTPISYTPPVASEVTVSPVPNKGALLVAVTNPAPTDGEPEAAWNDVYVDDYDTGFERRAVFIAPGGSWLYPTPISGRDYGGRIRVRTYAANGTWTETTTATSGDPVTGPFQYGGGYA